MKNQISYIIDEDKPFTGIVLTQLTNGRTLFDGLTFNEYKNQPHMKGRNVKEVTPEHVRDLIRQHRNNLISKEWRQINAETYHEALGAVPPICSNGPMFQSGECYQYDLHGTYTTTGTGKNQKYFYSLLPRGTTHREDMIPTFPKK